MPPLNEGSSYFASLNGFLFEGLTACGRHAQSQRRFALAALLPRWVRATLVDTVAFAGVWHHALAVGTVAGWVVGCSCFFLGFAARISIPSCNDCAIPGVARWEQGVAISSVGVGRSRLHHPVAGIISCRGC
jgi:hypothetical protein